MTLFPGQVDELLTRFCFDGLLFFVLPVLAGAVELELELNYCLMMGILHGPMRSTPQYK